MEFTQVVENRYSCKNFSGRKVEAEKLQVILEAGRVAPTAKNLQEQRVYVVQSEEGLKKIDAVTPCRYGAPTCLVVAFDKNHVFTYPGEKRDSGVEDASIVATHMMLAAANAGVDSCWLNFFDPDKAMIAFKMGGMEYTWPTVIAGVVVTFFVALVVIGGIKRIAKVSEIIVPFMAILYVVCAVILIVCNITKVPGAIVLVVKSAFCPKAVFGGAVGITVKAAMQKGIARGIFSNESGIGSAPIAAAAARTKEPVRQGLVCMTGTFFDTIIICTMTGLSIVLTGAYQPAMDKSLVGVAITTEAFSRGLPFSNNLCAFLLMISLVFFAFTTILGWDYYSEKCLQYLVGNKKAILLTFRILYIAAVFIGPYLQVSFVWTLADIVNALMAFPNLVALFALSGVVASETKAYIAKIESK